MLDEITPIASRLDLPRYLVANSLTGFGAEVGVLFGEYSAHLLEYWPGHLYMVDPWLNQDREIYVDGCNSVSMNRALAKAATVASKFGERAIMCRDFSPKAADGFADGSLDFVYIDANHSAPAVRSDLRAWWPKVRAGGVFGGHDLYERHDDYQECAVETEVRAFCAEMGVTFAVTECTSWWVRR